MSNPIDLERLRQIVHQNQRRGNTSPQAPQAAIVVDRNARIQVASEVDPKKRHTVSTIQQDTFHVTDEDIALGLAARTQGLIAPDIAERRVLIAGLGSGGSYVAEQLVRAGVRHITLADPDTVEAANLGRTCYHAHHIGMPKTEALAAHLRSIRPTLDLVLHCAPVAEIDADLLDEAITRADLVIALTDDPSAQSLLNHLCWHADTPAVFAGLYAGAAGGEVVISIPGLTPCYRCSTGGIRENLPGDVARGTDYGSGRLQGESALAADIHHLDSATVKLALSLLAGPDHASGRFARIPLERGTPYLCLSMSEDFWFFPEIFHEMPGQFAYQSVWLKPESHPDCPTCGVPVSLQPARAIPRFAVSPTPTTLEG